ncbi:MAG: cbb3-type cytochrome c oxidase subunit I [Bdellovibrionota bacterium]
MFLSHFWLESIPDESTWDFTPIFALYLYWLALSRLQFFQTIERGFLAQPVYIYMWAVGLLFFLYTFAEAHSWLLPQIYQYPLVDMQLQWKSAGTMVGSMNLLVYGSLAYLGSILNKGQKSCQTRLTFALFGIGLLNSFTNYTHHTYHLPQSQVVKWIGFVVSMSEAILLWRLVIEVSALWRQRQNDNRSSGNLKLTRAFIRSAKTWTLINLFYSLLISIPPLNTMIHGTHVVFAHAMGSMIGIDTMILLSVLSFFAIEYTHKDYCKNLFLLNKFRLGLNFGLFIVVATMTYKGILDGFASYMGESRDNHTMTLYLFACGGFLMAISLIGTALIWLRVFLPYFSIYKAKYIQTNPEFWHHEPISQTSKAQHMQQNNR